MKNPQQKTEQQTALNDEFRALVKQLEQINGRGEKTRISALLGVSTRQMDYLFKGESNVGVKYIDLVKARLRNAIGK